MKGRGVGRRRPGGYGHFSPIIEPRTGDVVCYEAWRMK